MLASVKLDADFSRGVQVRGSATHFPRPTPTTLLFANGSTPAPCSVPGPSANRTLMHQALRLYLRSMQQKSLI
jgi:hypothetical protein